MTTKERVAAALNVRTESRDICSIAGDGYGTAETALVHENGRFDPAIMISADNGDVIGSAELALDQAEIFANTILGQVRRGRAALARR